MGKIFGKRGTSSGSASGAVALAAGIALLLAGCGGDAPEETNTNDNRDVEQSGPAPEPDAPSPSASGSPESTAMPTSKAAVKQQLHDATVHFYETVDQAYMSGDVAALKELRDPNTMSSFKFAQDVRAMRQDDHQMASKINYRVDEFSIKRHGDDKTVDAFFTLSFDGSSMVDAQGNEVHSFEAGSVKMEIRFVREGPEWLVNRITEQ